MAKLFQLVTMVPLIVLIFFTSPLTPWKMTAAQLLPEEQPLSQGMIADLAKPAVVQIGTDHIATVSAPDWVQNTELLQQDLESSASENDDIDLDDEQVVAQQRDALFWTDPPRYMAPTEAPRSTQAITSSFGSGFIVTPDGYIVTNAHVVRPDAETENFLVQNAITNFILDDLDIVFGDIDREQAYQDIIQAQQSGAYVYLSEQAAALVQAVTDFYLNQYNLGTIFLGDIQSDVYASTKVSIPGVAESEKWINAEIIPSATGEPTPGKDVAVLKIQGSNLPTLPLGDETTLQSLDTIIAIGFPAIVGEAFQGQVVEPSITTGQLSGYQTTPGGWQAIQVQTPISSGNSGGPALDSSGRVVGVATFGVVDPVTGEASQSHNFLVPVSIVKDFLNRANIVPSESMFTQLYRQALIHYSAGEYNEAIDILQQINNIAPNNPYVLNYISRSQTQLGVVTGGMAGNPTDGSGNSTQ
jgi:serine protease Do